MMLIADIVASVATSKIKENNEFNKMCDALPADQAEKLKLYRKIKAKENDDHRKALELAREGRSLNFWGFR